MVFDYEKTRDYEAGNRVIAVPFDFARPSDLVVWELGDCDKPLCLGDDYTISGKTLTLADRFEESRVRVSLAPMPEIAIPKIGPIPKEEMTAFFDASSDLSGFLRMRIGLLDGAVCSLSSALSAAMDRISALEALLPSADLVEPAPCLPAFVFEDLDPSAVYLPAEPLSLDGETFSWPAKVSRGMLPAELVAQTKPAVVLEFCKSSTPWGSDLISLPKRGGKYLPSSLEYAA